MYEDSILEEKIPQQKPPETQEQRIARVKADSRLCEHFVEVLLEQIRMDDESTMETGVDLLDAYLERDVDGLLIALCGWRLDSLLNITEKGECA